MADASAIAEAHIRSWQAAYRGWLPDEMLSGLDAHLERRVGYRIGQGTCDDRFRFGALGSGRGGLAEPQIAVRVSPLRLDNCEIGLQR